MDTDFDLLKQKFSHIAGRSNAKGKAAARGPAAAPVLPAGWNRVDNLVWSRTLEAPNPVEQGLFAASLLNPGHFPAVHITFFDVETTGLSGGAGNTVFLIGLGTLAGKSLFVEQFFLEDFPGEAAFLSRFQPALDPSRLFVSYNGKSFDSHVLSTRYLLQRKELEFPHQLDLLHLCRRLWKHSLPSCSLGAIEAGILGRGRHDDIPGSEVPEVYFDYLRTGDTTALLRVFDHNYLDICSLAFLLQHLLCLYSGRLFDPLADYSSLGGYLLPCDERLAVRLLEEDFARGSQASGRVLSLHYRKKRQWDKAVAIWERMHRAQSGLFAAIELAKYYEHHTRNYALALEWVDTLLGSGLPLAKDDREEIRKRRNRLKGKIKDSNR